MDEDVECFKVTIPEDGLVVVRHGRDDAIVYVVDEEERDVLLSPCWGQRVGEVRFCPVVDHAPGEVTVEFGADVVGREVTVGVLA